MAPFVLNLWPGSCSWHPPWCPSQRSLWPLSAAEAHPHTVNEHLQGYWCCWYSPNPRNRPSHMDKTLMSQLSALCEKKYYWEIKNVLEYRPTIGLSLFCSDFLMCALTSWRPLLLPSLLAIHNERCNPVSPEMAMWRLMVSMKRIFEPLKKKENKHQMYTCG